MERVLLIPGLGDDTEALQPTVAHMKEQFGWETSVEAFGWMRTRDEYADRMRWMEELVEWEGVTVVVGFSAGAAPAVCLSAGEHQPLAVTVAGRVRHGGPSLLPPWLVRLQTNGIYNLALRECEGTLESERFCPERILTLHDRRDWVVPADSALIPDATNLRIDVGGPFWRTHVTMSERGLTMAADSANEWLNSHRRPDTIVE